MKNALNGSAIQAFYLHRGLERIVTRQRENPVLKVARDKKGGKRVSFSIAPAGSSLLKVHRTFNGRSALYLHRGLERIVTRQRENPVL